MQNESVAEQVETFISKKIARVSIWAIGVLTVHSFIAGGAWMGLKSDSERNRDDIVDLANLQKQTATQLQDIANEQAKRTANVSAVSEMRGELRAMNDTLQRVREDVSGLKVRLERQP